MSKDNNLQPYLLEVPKTWEEHWKNMPEFDQKDLLPFQSIQVHFENIEDRKKFAKLIGQTITNKSKYIWYPKAEIQRVASKRYTSQNPLNPYYPVYIISKGRWESRFTSKALEIIHVPYHIVVEPQEYDNYAAVIDPVKILVLPFSNLGQGSIPARNWVWEHSISLGARRHWILDDNITKFYRMCNNQKIIVSDGTIFRAAEDFVDRYTNVAISGFQYEFFALRRAELPPFLLNTRIYSCILIQNDIPYRWRGRYNEDTDLSLRTLKDGWCTILFNAFLAKKLPTMTVRGGNTDELYKDGGRLKMAQSLQEQHPNIVKITQKWGRWQHQVDYSSIKKNKLILRPDAIIPEETNDYGMRIETVPAIEVCSQEDTKREAKIVHRQPDF